MPESLIKRNKEGKTVAEELRLRLKRLLWATVILYIAVILLTVGGWYLNHQQTSQTHSALCSLRSDLEKRVTSTRALLQRFPQGIDGLSREDLLKSIADTESTVIALNGLNCD